MDIHEQTKAAGKGCIPVPAHIKEKHFKLAPQALTPVDWSVPFMVETGFTLPQRNQDGSSSCTAQAACYYCEALDPQHDVYSARYIYSQTHLPSGGAYIATAMSIPLKGLASLASVPEGDSSEATMTDPSLNNHAVLIDRAYKYAMIVDDKNIDTIASAIRYNNGLESGFNGQNSMFSPDGTANVFTGPAEWGHAVWLCGYKLVNGIKTIVFKNSWGNWGTNGYGFLPESFIQAGLVYDLYTYASVSDLQNMVLTADDVAFLQSLEGYNDPAGIAYWTGKTLQQYKAARVPDKIKGLQALNLNAQ